MNVDDPYIWMENLEDERVKKFINVENEKLRGYLGNLPNRMVNQIKEYFFKPVLIQARFSPNGFFMLKRVRDRYLLERYFWNDNEPVKILDSKELGEDVILLGFKYYEPINLLLYSMTQAGSDIMTLKIIDLETREVIDELKGSIWSFVFLGERKYFYTRFYRSEKTPDGVDPPATRVLLREYGEDTMVFGEGIGTNYFIDLRDSLDETKALIQVSYGWSWGKIYGGDLRKPDSWHLLYESKDNPVKLIDFVNGYYYFIGYGVKETGGLFRVDEEGNVENVVPEGIYPLESGIASNEEILLQYLVDAVSIVKSYNIKTGEIKTVFDRQYYSYHFHHSIPGKILISRTTFWIPYHLILYENGGGKVILGEEVDGEYVVQEDFAESQDGVKIHYFKFKKINGKGDTALVLGYGGFGISYTPGYIMDLIKLVDDGHTVVLTNLRGGSEYGEKWHKDGMLFKKMNVFNDYISVLEKLRREGYKTVAMGGSNGGLLVGATLNMRPDLIDVALIGYPVLDMLRFHKLYIGRAWVPEYGDPDDPKHREYLLKYSPYHNIDPSKKYPPTLVFTGLHDDRVHPAHALKYVAKMREINAPIYLRVETKSGHMGSSPETRLKERADLLAFIYKTLNLDTS